MTLLDGQEHISDEIKMLHFSSFCGPLSEGVKSTIEKVIPYHNARSSTNKNMKMKNGEDEQLLIEGLDSGINMVTEKIKNSLNESDIRPQIVFVNGYAGGGKTYASEKIIESLKLNGIEKSIFIETDNYHEEEGVEVYTSDYFSEQKKCWESGEAFEYNNTFSEKADKKEIVKEPDVIIIGGIGANKASLDINSVCDIFIDNPFLSRLENKGFRDYIANYNPDYGSINDFIDDICDNDTEHGTLEHLLLQENKLKKYRHLSNIVINNQLKNKEYSIEFKDGKIIFNGNYKGTKYAYERELSPKRLELIKKIVEINEVQGIRTTLPLPETPNIFCDCGLLCVEMSLKARNEALGVEEIREDFYLKTGVKKVKGGFTYPGHICKYLIESHIDVKYYSTIDWSKGVEDNTIEELLESSIIRGEKDKLLDSAGFLDNNPDIIINSNIGFDYMKEYLQKGKSIIAIVGGDHYINITGIDSEYVYINNPDNEIPNSNIVKNTESYANDIRKQRIPINDFSRRLNEWGGEENKTEIIVVG